MIVVIWNATFWILQKRTSHYIILRYLDVFVSTLFRRVCFNVSEEPTASIIMVTGVRSGGCWSDLRRGNGSTSHVVANQIYREGVWFGTVKLHLWALVIRIGLVLRVKFVENSAKITCLKITDQVQYGVMASRTSNQAWSKGLDTGTYCK